MSQMLQMAQVFVSKSGSNIGCHVAQIFIDIHNKFKTMSGLPFTYTLKKGRGDEFTKELWINRREESKSLAWSSVMLAYHNIGKIGEVVNRPKALGDIRGVSYIYGLFYRFGLIDVPDKAKEKMGGKKH